MIHVEIWHNKNERESFFRGYQQFDPVEKVYESDMHHQSLRDDAAICEYVFQANQHVSASHQPWYRGRSLSVGDVIVVNDRAYAVDQVGFQETEWMQ